MKIQKLFISAVIIILSGLQPVIADENHQLTVTYIANEGFLLEGGEKKVLIDAVFGNIDLNFCDVPSKKTLDKLLTAQPPFDHVDLLLVTHRHLDHFDANLTAEFMINNKDCYMVGTQQTVDKLLELDIPAQIQERIHSFTPPLGQSENAVLKGMDISVLRLKHCVYFDTDKNTGERIDRHRNMQNLGFLIRIGNHTVLHTGDSGMESGEEYKRFDLDTKEIDIAFLGSLFWKPCEPRIKIVNEHIKPESIVPVHLDKGDKGKYVQLKETYQERLAPVIIFKKEMEQKVFIK